MNLDPAELAQLIADGEGKSLEFKRGLPGDAKVARTLCAFANTRGGLLLIGVGDRGELFGAPHPRETLAALRRVAAASLEPALEIQGGIVALAGVKLVWCSVPLSPARPHTALDAEGARELVVRVGSSNRRASTRMDRRPPVWLDPSPKASSRSTDASDPEIPFSATR